ncbi:MAG: leucine-rich repeat domain-containing protein, partial [Oscillospiraceae bacterium]
SGEGVVTTTSAAEWSDNRDQITSVVIEEGITDIGANVFQNYAYITKVSFPSTLNSIGDLAFSGCTKLASVSIPAVEALGEEVFRGCTALTTATIADGVTELSAQLFAGCTALKTVAIPSDSLVTIGDYAFTNCVSLEKVNYITKSGVKENTKNILEIPSGVETIGSFAFQGCSNFESLIISETVTYIGGSVFTSCNNLKEVTVANGELPLVIDSASFKNLSSLTAVTLNRVTALGESVFAATGIARISLPSTLTYIGKYCFQSSKLQEITFMPSDVEICAYAFADCEYLNNVDMRVDSATNTGVSVIGEYAFMNCTALEAITIPASETKMGKLAFQNCTALKTVTIAQGAKAIGEQAFSGCPITSIEVPASVVSMTKAFASHATLQRATLYCPTIGNSAFKGCSVLETVNIKDGVTKLDLYCFQSCPAIKTIVLPSSVTELGNYSFASCTNLTDVTMPNVATISASSFEGDSALTGINAKGKITLPETLTSLGASAFKNCTEINNVTIPDGVRTLSKSLFESCSKLSTVSYGENITIVDDKCFYKCIALESFKFPKLTATIGTSTFEGCTALKTVDTSNSPDITTIRASAFKDCDVLNNVVIPAGVTVLNDNLFNG